MHTVYLDSSDYSRFSNNSDSIAQQVYCHLRKLRKTGRWDFRYSGYHVFEMVQMHASSKTAAESRLSILSWLSKGKAFAFLLTMVASELSSMRDFGYIKRDVVMRSDHDWIGRENGGFVDDPEVTAQLAYAMQVTATPSKRRQLSQSLGYNSVTLGQTELLKKMLENGLRQNGQSDEEISPLVEIALALNNDRLLLEPKHWAYITDRLEAEEGSNMRDEIHSLALAHVDELEALRAPFYQINSGIKSRKAWSKLASNYDLDGEFDLNEVYETLGLDQDMIDSALDEKFSGKSISRLLEIYRHEKVLGFGNKPKIKHSDILDIFHMLYIPYCDFFRSDSAMGSVAMEFSRRFPCQVFTKMEDLLQLR